MAIDFSRLDISLDKFNAESSGMYNIGHLKLSSDGTSGYRTNNHKTFTLFNNTKISSEEALAVKFAFCKALGKGVSEKYADKNLQHRYSDRTLLGNDFMLDDSKITCTSTYKLTIN